MWFLLLLLCLTNAEKNPFLVDYQPPPESGKTQVNLECRSDGMMGVTLTFCHAFCGTVQTDQCYYQGDGNNVVKLNLPLSGCGTIEEPSGTYTTNLTVKFYPCHYHGIKKDEIITIICHYNITLPTTTEPSTTTTATTTSEATTTPDDVVVIGRIDEQVDPVDDQDSNITINIQQSSVLPWIIGVLALIIVLAMAACCIYFGSKRRVKFIQSHNSNSGAGWVTNKSESQLSSDSVDHSSKFCNVFQNSISNSFWALLGMMVKSNVETQTERMKRDLEGEQLLKAQEQILTTILESTETETMETLERTRNVPIQLESQSTNGLSYFYGGQMNGFDGRITETQEAQMDFHQEESSRASQEAAFYQNAHELQSTSFMRR